MNVPLTPEPRTRATRAWKFVKWFLIAVAGLIVINWAGSWMLASSNQRIIDDFQEKVGAKSLRELAGAKGAPELLAGNGWHYYMAAIGCIDPEIASVFSPPKGKKGPAPTDEQMAAREAQLDLAHPLIAAAVASPKNLAVLHYDDPINMQQPHLFPSMRYARLACSSARDHLAAGRTGKAAERLLDALELSEGVLQLPTLLCLMVRIAGHHNVIEVLAVDLRKFPTETLQRFAERLESIDVPAATQKALAGEVFFGLHVWKRVSKFGEVMDDVDPPGFMKWCYVSLLIELDKRVYLNRMVPLALDPTPETAKRVNEEPVPFYAPLTRTAVPMLGNVIKGAVDGGKRLAVVKEALRLEIGRRKTGVLLDVRREVDGVDINATKSDKGITLTAPAPGDGEPLTITIRP